MPKKKCDYCGAYYDEEDEGTLNNGSPACPNCVADEEADDGSEFEEETKK